MDHTKGFTDQEFTTLAVAVATAVGNVPLKGKTVDEVYGDIYTKLRQTIQYMKREGQERIKGLFHGPFHSLRWRMSDMEWRQFMAIFRQYAFTPQEFDKMQIDELSEMRLAQAQVEKVLVDMRINADRSEKVAEQISKIEKELDQQEGEAA